MTGPARQRIDVARPGDADAAAEAGIAALKEGQEEAALPVLERAVAEHPGDPRLWQLLGLLHRGLEDLAPAVDALARAAALAPADALIAHGHARARLEAGLPSVAAFERAEALAPLDGGVLLGKAAALFADRGPGEAAASLAGQLRRHPAWVEGHKTLARLRWMAGDGRVFTAGFEEALAAAPRDLALWKGLLDTYAEAEMYDEALAAVARGRASAGANPLFDAYEAVATSEAGRADAAEALFERLGPPRDMAMLVRRVRHLLRAGRPLDALALAEPAAGQAGGELWPYLSLGWRLTGDPRWRWLEGDPRLVGVYDIADRLPPLDALADRLRSLHLASRQPIEQSVRGGTQTDGPLFARIDPLVRAARTAVVEAVEAHLGRLPAAVAAHPLLGRPRGPVRFAGSWSVRLTAGGRHANHVHPAGWISSALYVALPAEGDRGAPPAGWLTLGEPQQALGLDLPALRTIEPKPGRLVLFPSTMWHGTIPFGSGERLTIAFDVATPRSRA